MAGNLTVLYFDDTDATASNHKWVQLKNRVTNPAYNDEVAITNANLPYQYSGGSPVISCRITDDIGLPLECNLIINNRQTVRKAYEVDSLHPLAFGPNPLANGQVSQFNGLLPELTRIIVHDSSNFMTLFVGRIHKSEEPFLANLGTTLKLTCFDVLQDLVGANTKNFSTEERKTKLRGVGDSNGQGTTITNGPGNYPYNISRRLDQIKDFILKATYGTATTQAIGYVDHKIDNGSSYIKAFQRDELRDNSKEDADDSYGKVIIAANDTDILRRIQILAQSERWYIDASTAGIGFEFFLDATRTTPIHALSTVPQQDFTYFRKGHYSTSSPETYGLTAKYALTESVDDNQTTSNDIIRNMFNDFNFAGFSEDIVTHVAITHKGRTEYRIDVSGNYDRRQGTPEGSKNLGGTSDKYPGVKGDKPASARIDVFTLLYIKPLIENGTIGTFRYAQPIRADGASSSLVEGDFDVRSIQQVTSLHKSNGVDSGVFTQTGESEGAQTTANTNAKQFFEGSTKTWIGNIQYSDIDANGNPYIIITEPQDDIIATLSENDILYERGWTTGQEDAGGTYTPTYIACKFKSSPVTDQQIKKFAYSDIAEFGGGPDEYYAYIRMNASTRLAGGNNDKIARMRSGMFRIKDWPHMRWTGEAQSGTSTSSLKPVIAATKTPLDYGMRRGCSVIKESSSGVFAGYISAIDTSNDALTVNLFKTSLLGTTSESSTGVGGWAVDDIYNIYVPLRSGMAIRVDNATAVTVGDHLITSIIYEWDNGHVSSEIGTVGINDKVMYKTAKKLISQQVPSIVELAESTTQDAMALASGAYEARGMVWWHDHAYGAAPNLAAATLRDYNSFSWSGGLIKVHSVSSHPGRRFQLNPGSTDAALTAAAYPSPMQANKQYVLYFDRNAEKADGTYDVQAAELTHDDDGYSKAPSFINLAYLTIGTNEDAGSKEIKGNFNVDGSLYTVNIPFDGSSGNGMGMVNIHFMNTFSNVLGVDSQVIEASRIIQPNSMTTALLAKGTRPWTSNLAVKPRNNLYNQVMWDNGSSGGASTLTFGNDDVVTISAGNTGNLANNSTNYMYLDGTSAGLTGTLPVSFTTTHATATGDSKVLLGLVVVGADATQKSPTILPFNSKAPTINATVIAADAIIATHVQAGTLDTGKLTVAARAEISEKTITTASTSTPSNPRHNDVWFDLNTSPVVIKVYDSTTSTWEIRNANAPEGEKGATLFQIEGTATTPVSFAAGDIWIKTSTQVQYIASAAGVSGIVTSGNGWYKHDYMDAINNGSTTIDGGLVNTARIILKQNGAAIDGLFMTGATAFSPASGQSYIDMSHTSIKGVSRASTTDTTQFELKATDGKAYFIGGAAVIDVDGLSIYNNATQSVKRSKLAITSGLQLENSVNSGVWWNEAGESNVSSAQIYTTGTGSLTYGSGDEFYITTSPNDLILTSFSQDIAFYPDPLKGKVAIGNRPLVFMESGDYAQATGSSSSKLHDSSDGNYVGLDRVKEANPTYSMIYQIPYSGGGAGKVLALKSGTFTGSGTTTSPYIWDLEWVTNSGSGGSGTVTSVATSGAITGGPITATGTISHTTGNQYEHIPPWGSSGQLLVWSTTGAATWQAPSVHGTHSDTTYTAGSGLSLSGTEFSTTGSSSGVGLGDNPTWTGAHTWTSTMSVDDGTSSALSIRRRADTTTGFYFYNSGSYKGMYCEGNGRTLWYAASDGTNDWMNIDSWLDMNDHGITDCNEIQTTNGSSSDPSYTFTNSLTSGVYKGTYGVAITDEGTLSFEVDNTYAYNYKKVYIADIPTGSGGTAIKHVGGTIKEVSSTRLAKMDIQDIVIDSSKIYNLNPVSFRYRTQQVNEDGSSVIDADGTKYYTDVPEGGPDSPLDFGMIAEEVYEHIPELVSVNPKTKKPIGVDYAAFSVLLLEELKKLKARIDVLEGN